MSKIQATVEDKEYHIAWNKLTEEISKQLGNVDEEIVLNPAIDIRHEIVFRPGKRAIHRLHWLVNEQESR